MCDTIGRISKFFGKNSDRSANEIQVNEWYPATVQTDKMLKATYMEIDQAKETKGVLLSRPTWMWGAEIGINECGVAIGNEAVFTKGTYARTGLTGMDMLRVALERSENAENAVMTIIELLERYGQGGNCGFDHSFYYDNAFLIMDRYSGFILETAGRKWVYRQIPKEKTSAISNRLSIGENGDKYSEKTAYHFAKKHIDPLYSHFSGSNRRLRQTSGCSCETLSSVMDSLRSHEIQNPFIKGTVKSPCMHAGGLVGDHTTASMIVDYTGDDIAVWMTGSSLPCVSLYKPYLLGAGALFPVFPPESLKAQAYWQSREMLARSFIGGEVPAEYHQERDELESRWGELIGTIPKKELSETVERQDREFFDSWRQRISRGSYGSTRFKNYWKAKDKALMASITP